ncbi:MAG: hypothetical protein ACYC3I_10890 [Gemmataceae bacterium]
MNSTTRSRFPLWMFALSAVLLVANSAQAGCRYYMLIFAAQTHPKIPRFTHTFCTIVKVADAPPGCRSPYIEASTISWLPATLKIKPYRLHPEPGRNLTLEETLSWAAQHHMHVSEWGPYEIEEDYYWRVYREYSRFESGEFLYRAIDSPRRGDVIADCIHAVTDIDRRDPRTTYRVLSSGDAVTRKFVRILRERNRLFDPPEDVSWLNAVLGLDCYPIVHRPTPCPH